MGLVAVLRILPTPTTKLSFHPSTILSPLPPPPNYISLSEKPLSHSSEPHHNVQERFAAV
jgi:hypothetical protein